MGVCFFFSLIIYIYKTPKTLAIIYTSGAQWSEIYFLEYLLTVYLYNIMVYKKKLLWFNFLLFII